MEQGIVVGIDGGGTYTRVVISDLKGNVLSSSQKSGCHPGKNRFPEKNVKEAMIEALQKRDIPIESVIHVVGGFAGFDEPEEIEQYVEYLSLPGLNGKKTIMNDAEVAHYGAFLGKPGIMAVSGTGSIVIGKTENEELVRNYDFHQGSDAGSNHLSYPAIYEIISHKLPDEEQSLISEVLKYWEVETIEELRTLASMGFSNDEFTAIQRICGMGPIITAAAVQGSEVANRICRNVVRSLFRGIGLVASMFSSETIPLALTGSVIKHPYMLRLLHQELEADPFHKKILYTSSQLSPVLGALLYAYKEIGVEADQKLVKKLQQADQDLEFYMK